MYLTNTHLYSCFSGKLRQVELKNKNQKTLSHKPRRLHCLRNANVVSPSWVRPVWLIQGRLGDVLLLGEKVIKSDLMHSVIIDQSFGWISAIDLF